MPNNLQAYIKKTSQQILNEQNFLLYNKVTVFAKDDMNLSFPLFRALQKLEKVLSEEYFYEIDAIIFGDFREFKERDIRAFYKDGAIYVTSEQNSIGQLLRDIVHEVGHSIEKRFGVDIYADGELEEEFISKRIKLFNILRGTKYEQSLNDIMHIRFSKEFDNLLYREIGYDNLHVMTSNIFLSPYSITSIREYFATGFEFHHLFSRDGDLAEMSPVLLKKIMMVEDLIEEG